MWIKGSNILNLCLKTWLRSTKLDPFLKFSSSTSNNKKLWNYGILSFFFLAHSFMNRFWSKFRLKLSLTRQWSITSKVILKFRSHLFLRYNFCFKTFEECQHYEDANFSLNDGQIRPPLCQNRSSTFVYGPILMKIFMNANITKRHLFINVTSILWRSFVIFLLSDLLTLLPWLTFLWTTFVLV